MRFRLLSVILLIVLFAPLAQAQKVVFLIRHAEQVLDVEDPPLTEAGQQRAKAWATILRDAGLDVVFTSKKARTKQTGEAVARELQIPLEAVSRRDVSGLVERIRVQHADDAVLVVSHTRTIPKLVEAFGSLEDGTINREDYDNVFVIVPSGDDGATVLRLRY